MIFDLLAHNMAFPKEAQLVLLALDSAITYRNRSFDSTTSAAERRAFRMLMRQQSILWRRMPGARG